MASTSKPPQQRPAKNTLRKAQRSTHLEALKGEATYDEVQQALIGIAWAYIDEAVIEGLVLAYRLQSQNTRRMFELQLKTTEKARRSRHDYRSADTLRAIIDLIGGISE